MTTDSAFDRLLTVLHSVTTHDLTVEGDHSLTVWLSAPAAEDLIRILQRLPSDDANPELDMELDMGIPPFPTCAYCGVSLDQHHDKGATKHRFRFNIFRCMFPGCHAQFHPEAVAEPGPGNDPPGDTGWTYDKPDDLVPVHLHTLKR